MRELHLEELSHVSGAGGYYPKDHDGGYDDDDGWCDDKKGKKGKGNNGYGNGGHDGSPNGKQDKTR
jgi:hypothetical protein